MMQFCFPTVYWHFSIGHIDLEDLRDKCVVNKEWNCLVKTSRGIKYDWSSFFDVIQPYFSQISFKKDGMLLFQDPWMNVYEKGCYQESHQHVANGQQLSYCYFYKLPEGSGKFGFWNELFRNYCCNGLFETVNFGDNFDIVEWGFPEIKEGDLLVFPSFLIHQVTYHGIDEPRITVSGNLKMVGETKFT